MTFKERALTERERERQRGLGAVPREDISVTWGWGGESASKENRKEIHNSVQQAMELHSITEIFKVPM